MNTAILCKTQQAQFFFFSRIRWHRTDTRGGQGYPYPGSGWSWKFLGSPERQPQQILSERGLDDPVEWRLQGSRDNIHLWEDGPPGEPDVSWAHHRTALDSSKTGKDMFSVVEWVINTFALSVRASSFSRSRIQACATSTRSIEIPQTTTTSLHRVSSGSLVPGLNAALPVEQVGASSSPCPAAVESKNLYLFLLTFDFHERGYKERLLALTQHIQRDGNKVKISSSSGSL